MKPLVLPKINLNGTTRRQLLIDQQINALQALRAAQTAMCDAMPHGRDFQLNPTDYAPARAAWMDRIQLVYDLSKEVEAHALAIHHHA
jgi:hypothetical protein